jgi:hypothetical protein
MAVEPLPRRETCVVERYEPDALGGAGDWWQVSDWSDPANREEAIKLAKFLVSSRYLRQDGTPATDYQKRNGFKHRVLKETVSYAIEWESDNGESE